MTESMATTTITTITAVDVPKPAGYEAIHHVGSPRKSFKNPWPSAGGQRQSLLTALKTRFFNSKARNHVPVPADRVGLPQILTPTWGRDQSEDGMKVTWIGHASFLVEMPTTQGTRGVRIFFDPVFSSNMSPFSFGGPARISAPPCPMEDVPEVDIVVISHDHYDHLDVSTITFLNERAPDGLKVLCGAGVGRHLVGMGVAKSNVMELDWWEGALVDVSGVGQVRMVCTPSQHFSGRWWNDLGHALWCSWVLEEVNTGPVATKPQKKLYFAGDTGYRFKAEGTKKEDYDALPCCPAFAHIGELYGPFDLSLLPIGCYAPRYFMSHIHCAPEDSICIHRDVKSKRSLGMHYGTVRGNISVFYEDSVEPAKLWKEECERAGLTWNTDVGLCDIGETVVV